MSKHKLCITLGIVFDFVKAPILLTQQVASSAQECNFIRIEDTKGISGKSMVLDPVKVTASKGSCVVWINLTGQPIKVVFKENGKRCSAATNVHTGFKLKDACFVSDMIPDAGTSSLQFIVSGTFRYEIEIPPAGSLTITKDKIVAKGEVVVE